MAGDLRSFPARNPEAADPFRIEADERKRNRERMRCPLFQEQALPLGANAVIAPRCNRLSGKLEDS